MREAREEMLQSLNESNLEKMRKAAKGAKQTLKMKDGSIGMDSFTASAIMQIYDKVNDKNKKTMENLLKDGKKADIVKLMKFAMSKVNAEYVPEESELDEASYALYHKDFSSAMQHSYKMAKKMYGITIDPKEIDDKVASGPKKPSEGKTNSYRLKGDKGAIQVQVYNKGGSKPFELNMYKEEVELDEKLDKEDEPTVKAVVKMLKKASNAHAGQAKDLEKAVKEDGKLDEIAPLLAIGGGIAAKYAAKKAGKMIAKRVAKNVAKKAAKAAATGVAAYGAKKAFDAVTSKKKETPKAKNEDNTQEGFASDAQRRAAFASGYKEKGKKKKESEPIDEIAIAAPLATGALTAIGAYGMNKMLGDPNKKKQREKTESAASDARRAMASDPSTKQKFSKNVSATDDDVKAADKNIIMQMRKAVSLRGNKVEFMDKKKVMIPQKIAQAVITKFNNMKKPADKEKFQSKISKSYKSMLTTLKERNEINNKNNSLDQLKELVKEMKGKNNG